MNLTNIDSGSLRRILVTVLGIGALALNKKSGLALGDVEIEAIAALASVFLLGSNYKEAVIQKAKVAGETAAASVDAAAAKAVLTGEAKP